MRPMRSLKSSSMSNACLLLVEDEAIIAIDVARRLRRLGYTVLDPVRTGEAAIEVATNKKPDLVLMDIHLEGEMDGTEAARTIYERLRMPVVFMTAYSDVAVVQRAQASEPYGYVIKPFRDQELYVAVELALEKARIHGELRRSRRLFQRTLGGITSAVVTVDADGVVTYLNEAAVALTGLRREKAVGRTVDEVVEFESDGEPHLSVTAAAAAGGDPVPKERQKEGPEERSEAPPNEMPAELREETRGSLVRADGSTMYVARQVCSLYDDNGEVDGHVIILRDVRAEKIREDYLLAAKEAAERSIQAKADFLANISHELRTPLNSIVGMTELALDLATNSDQREYLEVVRTGADTLLGLIESILGFSRLEAGSETTGTTPFDLNEFLAEVAERPAAAAREKGLEFILDASDDLSPIRLQDRDKLRQILASLLSNAVKFTDTGMVKFTVRAVGDSCVRFLVSDTGLGVPKDAREAIFEPFTQADGTSTRRAGGAGLGLSLADGLAKLIGATLELASSTPEGTTFSLTVPMRAVELTLEQRQTEVPRVGDSDPGGPLSILLADDNHSNRLVNRKILERGGYRVTAVAGGEEVLEMIGTDHFDVLVLDIQMPGIDGIELTRHIRALDGFGRTVGIVGLSVYSEREYKEAALSAGMNAYVEKPYNSARLYRAIESAYNQGALQASGT